MQSPVSKLIQLRIAEYIAGETLHLDPYTEADAAQEAYRPLREHEMLCEAFIAAMRLEITALLGVTDKTRRVVLKRKDDVQHKALVEQRDKAWEDYEILRRMICPDDTQLMIERVSFRYI